MSCFSRELNSKYFSGPLSPGVLAELDQLDGSRAEVLEFIERLLRIFSTAKIDATDISVASARGWREVVPHVLPGAWGGMIPSVTFSNRHIRIDEYFARNHWHKPGAVASFADLKSSRIDRRSSGFGESEKVTPDILFAISGVLTLGTSATGLEDRRSACFRRR